MKQVVQSVANGALRVVEVPRPTAGVAEVLVATRRTLISAGTERAVRALASSSLVQKARARPDLVRQVIIKARAEGVRSTFASVRSRLDEQMPLGYSGVGIVAAVGEAVRGLRPGQRVATGSAGHAEFQLVPAHLAVPVPDAVSDEEAAFATVAAIALHGLRQAEVAPGARIAVIGLGLLGQLTARLAMAAGCEVVGIDVRPIAAERLGSAGGRGFVERGQDTTADIVEWSLGRGVDAVVLTAATASSGPIRRAAEICRDRGRLVVVGDVGLELERPLFYEKELELRFARSYGPGRYDRSYEEWGIDYPIGYVRWTEERNLEAYLSLVAAGRLQVVDLVTHTFPVEQAAEAYACTDTDPNALGVQLSYGRGSSDVDEAVPVSPKRGGGLGVGLLGAGTYARATLLPALEAAGYEHLVAVASATGLSARYVAERHGFERAFSSAEALIGESDVDLVIVATRHDSHAELVTRALDAGKHVFCEKPLALSDDQMDKVATAWRGSPGQLFVGFNRRYSPPVAAVRRHVGTGGGPLVLTYRVSAGTMGGRHWYHDRRQGGRLLGEVCHFIDTCAAIVAAPIESVVTVGAGRDEALLEDDLALLLRFADGSVATITYATGGHAGTPKERLEVLGHRRTAVIDDFRRTLLDGREVKQSGQGKGHLEALRAFRSVVAGDEDGTPFTTSALATTAATLAAAEALLTGAAVAPATV